MENTETTPIKKRSSFKRTLMYLLVLGVIGGAGYIAYEEGAMDAYLPQALKVRQAQPEPITINVAPAKPDANPAPDSTASVNTTATANPVTNTDVQTALSQLQGAQTGSTTVNGTPNLNNNLPAANVPSASAAPVTIAINGAPANALFAAYDAQWQWQSIEQSFKSQGDIAATLQQTQALKTQLQAANSVAFAPTLTALSQVESQLQAWTPLQTVTYMSALQQTIADVDGMTIKTPEADDVTQATVGEQSWWQRILASLKNVIEIKRVDEQKNNAALSASTAALVKQSIIARLSSAQLVAQTGQWQLAQTNARAAEALAQQWADASTLSKLKPLLEVASFPAAPDFSTVHSALMQARTQLINEARAAQALPAPISTPATTTPAAPAPATPAASATKGGA